MPAPLPHAVIDPVMHNPSPCRHLASRSGCREGAGGRRVCLHVPLGCRIIASCAQGLAMGPAMYPRPSTSTSHPVHAPCHAPMPAPGAQHAPATRGSNTGAAWLQGHGLWVLGGMQACSPSLPAAWPHALPLPSMLPCSPAMQPCHAGQVSVPCRKQQGCCQCHSACAVASSFVLSPHFTALAGTPAPPGLSLAFVGHLASNACPAQRLLACA